MILALLVIFLLPLLFNMEYSDSKTLYDIVDENLATGDITQLKILLEYINEYKKTKSIRSFIKFLICFISNPYTTGDFDDKVINFIYNKLFNKGDDKNE